MPFSKVKIDWTYDALNRLTAETRDADTTPGGGQDDFGVQDTGDYTDVFGFDLSGNRLLKQRGWDDNGNGRFDAGETVDERTAYRYNARDQLLGEGPDANADGLPDPATETTYGYDANGNTTVKGSDTYTWDLRGRLAAVDTNGDGILDDAGDAVYAYDHNGTRVGRTLFAIAGDDLSFTAWQSACNREAVRVNENGAGKGCTHLSLMRVRLPGAAGCGQAGNVERASLSGHSRRT